MARNIADIVEGEFIKSVFHSKEFTEMNWMSGLMSFRLQRETGYAIFKSPGSDDVVYSRIMQGTKQSITMQPDKDSISNSGRLYELMWVHFHPTGMILPSLRDLMNTQYLIFSRDGFFAPSRPLRAVGNYNDTDRNTYLLVYQQRRHVKDISKVYKQILVTVFKEYILSHDSEEVESAVDDCNVLTRFLDKVDDPYVVSEKMDESGVYNSDVVRISASRKVIESIKEPGKYTFKTYKTIPRWISDFLERQRHTTGGDRWAKLYDKLYRRGMLARH